MELSTSGGSSEHAYLRRRGEMHLLVEFGVLEFPELKDGLAKKCLHGKATDVMKGWPCQPTQDNSWPGKITILCSHLDGRKRTLHTSNSPQVTLRVPYLNGRNLATRGRPLIDFGTSVTPNQLLHIA